MQTFFEVEESLGLEELVLRHHVQSRWLSLLPALEWLVEIKDALKKLVIDELPNQDKNIRDSDKYSDVKRGLESKEMLWNRVLNSSQATHLMSL